MGHAFWSFAGVAALLLQIAIADLTVLIEPWGPNSLRVRATTNNHIAYDLPGALLAVPLRGSNATLAFLGKWSSHAVVRSGNLRSELRDGALAFTQVHSGTCLATCSQPAFAPSVEPVGYESMTLNVSACESERIYGLGQLENTSKLDLCDAERPQISPLARNGYHIRLESRKFHISIPLAVSSRGYAILFNHPGMGTVDVGLQGGTLWHATHARQLDFWVTTTGPDSARMRLDDIYQQYSDVTGHAPLLPQKASLFWQSRLRYRTSSELEEVAERYRQLQLPVGYFVVDFFNQAKDGDFHMERSCYPSVSNLTARVRNLTGASTMVSLWPDVNPFADAHAVLEAAGCLCKPFWYVPLKNLGQAIDPTTSRCRDLMWERYILPNYVEQGVESFWLDETDEEGTFGKGYQTACGPPQYCTRLWANDWIQTFSEGVTKFGGQPLVLTRGLWAGAQRFGVILWSSDIASTFEALAAQIGEGIAASLSGIPWWTSDVGGFGCPMSPHSNTDPYMQELIVRWYQFGALSPIFRTHGCRRGPNIPIEPRSCRSGNPLPFFGEGSCAGNEVWSYGPNVQPILERYIRLRAELAPYIMELAANVTASGVPTMRPLWYEFPEDAAAWSVEDQFLLGPSYLVAPVVTQGAVSRKVYFPSGAVWRSYWQRGTIIAGGTEQMVHAPVDVLPLFVRECEILV